MKEKSFVKYQTFFLWSCFFVYVGNMPTAITTCNIAIVVAAYKWHWQQADIKTAVTAAADVLI